MKIPILILLLLVPLSALSQHPKQCKTLQGDWNTYEFSALAKDESGGVYLVPGVLRKKDKNLPMRVGYIPNRTLNDLARQQIFEVTPQILSVAGLDTKDIPSPDFAGVEAAVFAAKDTLYLAMEGDAANCYILRATIKSNTITVDKSWNGSGTLPLPKPAHMGSNDGFESLCWDANQRRLIAIFEKGDAIGNHKRVQVRSISVDAPTEAMQESLLELPAGRVSDACLVGDTLFILNPHTLEEMNVGDHIRGYVWQNGAYQLKYTQHFNNDASIVFEGLTPHEGGFWVVSDDNNGPDKTPLAFCFVPRKSLAPLKWKSIQPIPLRPIARRRDSTITVVRTTLHSDRAPAGGDTTVFVSYRETVTTIHTLISKNPPVVREWQVDSVDNVQWSYSYYKNKELKSEVLGDRIPTLQLKHLYQEKFGDKSGRILWDTMLVVPDRRLTYRRDFRKLWEQAQFESNRTFLVLGASYTPALSYRNLRVQAIQFADLKGLQIRESTERSAYGGAATGSVGLTLRRTMSLALEVMYLQQGFNTDSLRLNWNTGLGETGSGGAPYTYRFRSLGAGLLYGYSSYRRLVNPAIDLGLYSMWNRFVSVDGTEIEVSRDNKLRHHNFVARGGVGLAFRPAYWFEARCMATLLYSLNSLDLGSQLRNNLYNAGVTAGLRLYLPAGLRRHVSQSPRRAAETTAVQRK